MQMMHMDSPMATFTKNDGIIILTLIGKSWKQNPKIGKSPTVFHGNKIQKNFKNPDLGTSPGVIYGNKIQAKILSTWS